MRARKTRKKLKARKARKKLKARKKNEGTYEAKPRRHVRHARHVTQHTHWRSILHSNLKIKRITTNKKCYFYANKRDFECLF